MFKSLLVRGFFIKVFLTFVFILTFNIQFIQPANAVSSLDACMRQPACASQLLVQTGAKQAIKKKAASQVVKKTAINLTKKTAKTTSIKTIGKNVLLLGVGARLADMVFGHLVDDGLDVIQDKIYQTFCNNFPGKCKVAVWEVLPANDRNESQQKPGYRSVIWVGQQNLTFDQRMATYGHYPYNLYNSEGERVGGSIARSEFTKLIYIQRGEEPVGFDNLSDEDKNKAIDDYLSNPDNLRDLFETTPVDLPGYEPGDVLDIDGEQVIVPEGESDEDEEDEEATDEQLDEATDEQLDEANKNLLDELNCPECEDSKYTDLNFFEYAIRKFIDEPKFPFDIFGDIPSGSAGRCPKVEMFGRSKELCFINFAISAMKYPVWIAWIIRLALSL